MITTQQKKILMYLKHVRNPRGAVEMAYALEVRLDSLSSLLRKMVKAKDLISVPGVGVRGGAGYLINKEK